MQNPVTKAEQDKGSDMPEPKPYPAEAPSDTDPEQADTGTADEHGGTHDGEEMDEHDLPRLSEEIVTLVEDVRTFVQTEIAYRRAMTAFIMDRAKAVVISGIVAAVLVFFAIFALVFGLILGLAPLITPWGATAVVVGLLLLVAIILGRRAAKIVGEILDNFKNSSAAADMLSYADRQEVNCVQTAIDESDKLDEQD